jgi:hypothetical protein
VTDPLEAPPLGKVPDVTKKQCPPSTSFADVSPFISGCTSCHQGGTARQPLQTEAQWRTLGRTALGLMSSGSMPPGQSGPPAAGPVYDFKEALRCWVEAGLP